MVGRVGAIRGSSLGPNEVSPLTVPRKNKCHFSVDNCGVRVFVNKPCLIAVDGFLQIEAIKIPGEVDSVILHALDLAIGLDLEVRSGEGVSTAFQTGQQSFKLLRVKTSGLVTPAGFVTTKNRRRGFSTSLKDRLVVTSAPANGGYLDLWLRLRGEIVAAQLGAAANTLLTGLGKADLLYAHLKSLSRGITVRSFQTDEPTV